MVYRSVFCRTKRLNRSQTNVTVSFRSVAKCQASFGDRNHVAVLPVSCSLSTRQILLLVLAFTLSICHHSFVCALPALRLNESTWSTSNVTVDAIKSIIINGNGNNDNQNRVTRQAAVDGKAAYAERREIIGFKFEGDSKSIVDNGEYVDGSHSHNA